ncbi:hypothetical protein NT017_30100 [Prolixibacter sp. NT017]|nr:hypothetical protein NT017_30100 [Prolixibacter sp. NT017]
MITSYEWRKSPGDDLSGKNIDVSLIEKNKEMEKQEVQKENSAENGKKHFSKDIILMVAVIAGLIIVLVVIKHLMGLQ